MDQKSTEAQIKWNTRGRSSRRKGKKMVMDGPYTETKELGFSLFEDRSLNDAMQKSGIALTEGEQILEDKEQVGRQFDARRQ